MSGMTSDRSVGAKECDMLASPKQKTKMKVSHRDGWMSYKQTKAEIFKKRWQTFCLLQ